MRDGHYIYQGDGFAFYFKCSDEVLKMLKEDKSILCSPGEMGKLLAGDGENIHFIGIYSTTPHNTGYMSIARGLNKLIKKEKPKSISWYDKQMKKFIIRRF